MSDGVVVKRLRYLYQKTLKIYILFFYYTLCFSTHNQCYVVHHIMSATRKVKSTGCRLTEPYAMKAVQFWI